VRFILASASASRQRVLTAAGIAFTAVPAAIDEAGLKNALLGAGAAAKDVAAALAEAKALHVSRAQPAALVLGADQTLLLGDELVSKCPDLDAARALLSRLRGRPHQLVGALVLARAGAVVWRHGETSNLMVRDFSNTFLDAYLAAQGEGILEAIGCYKLEGLGAQLFETVEGDYFSILGLPLFALLAELRRQGVVAT
jgi:septum formation protein